MGYSPPGLFLWPQICDSLPFHKHIQRRGDLWCPLQCRKFREQHGDAEGPRRHKRKSALQGTFPSISKRCVSAACMNRPKGLWKSCLVQMEGKRAVPALDKWRLPSTVLVLWWERYRLGRTAHMLKGPLGRWLPSACQSQSVRLLPWCKLLLQLSSWHSPVEVLTWYLIHSQTQGLCLPWKERHTMGPQGAPFTFPEPWLCVVSNNFLMHGNRVSWGTNTLYCPKSPFGLEVGSPYICGFHELIPLSVTPMLLSTCLNLTPLNKGHLKQHHLCEASPEWGLPSLSLQK